MAIAEEKPEVMTAKELADFLRLPESTVRRYAAQFGIPGRQIGQEWRFSRAAVQEWLRGQSGKEILLSQSGAFEHDDEDQQQLRAAIYRDRGRPESDNHE